MGTRKNRQSLRKKGGKLSSLLPGEWGGNCNFITPTPEDCYKCPRARVCQGYSSKKFVGYWPGSSGGGGKKNKSSRRNSRVNKQKRNKRNTQRRNKKQRKN